PIAISELVGYQWALSEATLATIGLPSLVGVLNSIPSVSSSTRMPVVNQAKSDEKLGR
ncbi:uncharacterized protein METZ01_LOCUS312254, partial [marine metagenome]